MILRSYFISNKTYCLVINKEGEEHLIIKAKGVFKDSLNLKDFKDMYLSNLNVKAFKSNTYKSFEFATVNLNQKEIILNYNAYTKRAKIFDKNGI